MKTKRLTTQHISIEIAEFKHAYSNEHFYINPFKMGETYFLQAAFRATTFFSFPFFFQYPRGVGGVGGGVEQWSATPTRPRRGGTVECYSNLSTRIATSNEQRA
jgi:hypothetical protein